MTTKPNPIFMPWREITVGVQFGTPFTQAAQGVNGINGSTVRVGVKDPKWKSKVRNLQSATNVYTMQDVRLVGFTPGKYRIFRYQAANLYRTMTGWGNFPTPLIGSLDSYLSLDSNVSNLALTRFVKKCKAASRTYRGFVGLGEFVETIRAIRHPLESLKRGFNDYGNAVLRNAKQRSRGVRTSGARRRAVSQAVSGTYLEFANGWGPLVRDIDDLAATVARQLQQNTAFTQRIIATARDDGLLGGKANGWVNTSEVWYKATWSGSRVWQTRIVGVVKVNVSGDGGNDRAFGITPSDFLPAVWELLPLSYVANAFVDITGWLETIGFDPSVLAWCSRTQKVTAKVNLSCTDMKVINLSDTLQQAVPSVMMLHGTAMVRDSPASFVAWPVLRVPGGQYNWARLANFSSLFTQFRSHSLNLWKVIG